MADCKRKEEETKSIFDNTLFRYLINLACAGHVPAADRSLQWQAYGKHYGNVYLAKLGLLHHRCPPCFYRTSTKGP